MASPKRKRWTINLFSQSQPLGSKKQESVSALLRRVAKSIDELGDVAVQDVVLHIEMDKAGRDWPSMTVYYYRR